MEKRKVITISGLPGSGKSTTAKAVAQALNYKHFSSGDFMRNIALTMGVTLNELGKIAETDQGVIDQKIDEEIRKIGLEDNIVIDSRLAFHWLPKSYKVFLDLPIEISKERIWANLKDNTLRQKSEGASSPEDVLRKITERLASEKKRYLDLYNLDYTKKENFDLVIDTNQNNQETAKEIILKEYQDWLKISK